MKVLKSIKVSIIKENRGFWDDNDFWDENNLIKNTEKGDTALSVATEVLNKRAFQIMRDPQFITIHVDEGYNHDNMSEYCRLTAFIYGELNKTDK